MTKLILFLLLTFSLSGFSREKPIKVSSEVDVVIRGGSFEPDVIGISSNKETTINFEMKDTELCKEKIVIRKLGIEIPISLNKKVSISLKDKKPGKYHIECETGAFCGVLFVVGDKTSQPEHYYVPHPE